MTDTDLTELVAIDPRRLDGVKSPANGLPFLIMKSVAKDVDKKGNLNEAPDISKAEAVLRLLAQLIQSEAREMEAGKWDEICDINMLADAARTIKYFRQCEAMTADGEAIMKSLESAIDRRSAELGVSSPMSDDASKDTTIANPPTDPTPSTSTDTPVEKSIAEQFAEVLAKNTADNAEALAKAMSERDEVIKDLRSEMAAIKAQPLPGGPAITNTTLTKSTASSADISADIERFTRLSKSTQDRELARYYADRVAELKGSAN